MSIGFKRLSVRVSWVSVEEVIHDLLQVVRGFYGLARFPIVGLTACFSRCVFQVAWRQL